MVAFLFELVSSHKRTNRQRSGLARFCFGFSRAVLAPVKWRRKFFQANVSAATCRRSNKADSPVLT